MKAVSFYHRETGLFNGTRFTATDDEVVALNTPADHIAIDGHHDSLSKRVNVETGALVDYQPPQPNAEHVWSDDTRRWQLSPAVQAKAARRAAAVARIGVLVDSQHEHVRAHCLGNPTAFGKLKAIDDEIATLDADAKS